MTEKGISSELAGFAAETEWEDLPEIVVRDVKHVLTEHIGCALAALSTHKGEMMAAIGKRFGGPSESSIIGTGEKVSCSNAALANGELMITLDYHDIIAGAHDGLFVIPPALAIAESTGASGRDLILAIALGLEISSRLARAAGWHNITSEEMRRERSNPPRNKNAHSNFGGAAGAARLLKLNEEKMRHVLGIAGRFICMSLTSGQREYSMKAMTKYVVPGWQNTGAVTAALLAEMGYTGDITVLDDPKRLNWYPEEITVDLGKNWVFNLKLHYKPYPCCGAFHSVLDCFGNIIEQNNLAPDDIEKVKIHGSFMPPAKEIESLYAGQFHVPYNVSLLAHNVPRGIEWAETDTKKNREILGFMDRVVPQEDPDFVKEVEAEMIRDPKARPARVSVIAGGKTLTNEIKHRRGDTFTDVSWGDKEISEKFRHNAARILTEDKIEKAVDGLMNLEKVDDISQLMRHITL